MTRPPISDLRLDRLVREVLTERAHEVASRAVPADAMAARLSARPRPGASRRTWLLVAAGLVAASLVGGLLVAGGVRLPWQPTPIPRYMDWTGPLRPDTIAMPVIPRGVGHSDGLDSASAWVDITIIRASGLEWHLGLAAQPPKAATLDPVQLTIEYGLVLDADGNGLADCHIGINNRTNEPGDFRVWVTDLTSGMTTYQAGPPYGMPIDFAHPDEGGKTMTFFFLPGAGRPCSLVSGTSIPGPLRYYAYASAMEDGRVVAWDYAPDASWLGRVAGD